jgi:hypothetical protein
MIAIRTKRTYGTAPSDQSFPNVSGSQDSQMHEAKPREDGDGNGMSQLEVLRPYDSILRAWSNRNNNNTVAMGIIRPTTSATTYPLSECTQHNLSLQTNITANTLQRTASGSMVNEAAFFGFTADFLLARSSGQPRQHTISLSII